MKQKLVNLKLDEVLLEPEEEILGLFVLKGDQELRSNIRFINKKRDSFTRISLKFILLDHSSLDLEATAVIQNGARNTDTYLKIDCLLLSDKARAHVVPCMEIMEDDVKGGHGATVGMLDEMQLWYLTSRGIAKEEAEKILIQGFAQDFIDSLENDAMRKQFEEEIKKLEI